jgi:hypothetical protein
MRDAAQHPRRYRCGWRNLPLAAGRAALLDIFETVCRGRFWQNARQ